MSEHVRRVAQRAVIADEAQAARDRRAVEQAMRDLTRRAERSAFEWCTDERLVADGGTSGECVRCGTSEQTAPEGAPVVLGDFPRHVVGYWFPNLVLPEGDEDVTLCDGCHVLGEDDDDPAAPANSGP